MSRYFLKKQVLLHRRHAAALCCVECLNIGSQTLSLCRALSITAGTLHGLQKTAT
jgi:hypothetical protein